MALVSQNSKEYFRTLNILYIGLFGSQVIFGLAALYINLGNFIQPYESFAGILMLLVPVLFMGAIVGGHVLQRRMLAKVKAETSLMEKMTAYRSVFIMKMALTEGASLLGIIAFVLTGNYIFIGISGLAILYLFFLKPSIERASRELDLSSADRMKIENPAEIITE